jgi:hypothetical protein
VSESDCTAFVKPDFVFGSPDTSRKKNSRQTIRGRKKSLLA